MKDLDQTDAAKWLDENARYHRAIDALRLRKVLGRQPKHCTWCGEAVSGRRQTWCSNECVNAWKSRCDVNYIKLQLLQRDGGVCALCGTETLELLTRLRRLRNHASGCRPGDPPLRTFRPHSFQRVKRLWRHWIGRGWQGQVPTPWEADHILPVVQGGGCCGIAGYRTLCIPCHKQVTADLAAERARERRDAERPLIEEPKL